MTNAEIADTFDEIADLLEFQGANPFRVRAYRNSARKIRDLGTSVAEMAVENPAALTEIEGIGKDLAEKIVTLATTGHVPQLDALRSQVPPGVMALLRIPGVGPKKAAALHKELRVTSLADLRTACQEHRVRALRGFGEKTEDAILARLDLAESFQQRMLWSEADDYVQALRRHLADCPGVQQCEFAGSYRRGKETIGDLDVLVAARNGTQAMDSLASFPDVENILARGDTKMSVRLRSGLQVDLRVVPEETFGAALQYFTGSKEHNVIMRTMARKAGLKVSEWGVFRGAKRVAGRTEEEVYAAIGLPWFPPEIREARREFSWAEAGRLPDLIELADIQGDLHMHTTATDGQATLEEMVAAARKRGLKYVAITDHSQRVTMARGLNAQRLRRQWEEIEAMNAKLRGFTILKGVEVDILEKGGLDLDDDVLGEADWVVASVHYGQNQPREQITRRIVEALAHPSVCAIAHPTGRLINRRPPYEVDLEEVFAAAREHRKAMELNANPWRLDLDDVACAAAKEHGIPIVISTDAHGVEGLDHLRHGVRQARRAGLTKGDVANTRTWKQLKASLGRATR